MHILKLHVDICVIQINKKLKLKKVGRKQKFPNKFLVRVGPVQFFKWIRFDTASLFMKTRKTFTNIRRFLLTLTSRVFFKLALALASREHLTSKAARSRSKVVKLAHIHANSSLQFGQSLTHAHSQNQHCVDFIDFRWGPIRQAMTFW